MTRQNTQEYSSDIFRQTYKKKHGENSVPSIEYLWECLEEIREDGTPKPCPDVPQGQLDNVIRLLSETKIPLCELKEWEWEALEWKEAQDEEDHWKCEEALAKWNEDDMADLYDDEDSF